MYILASSYIKTFWEGVLKIKSLRDILNWSIACFFHLSSFDNGEKPFFVMGLGYFSFLCSIFKNHLFFKELSLGTDSLFNIFLVAMSGYVIFAIFYKLKEPLFGIFTVSLVFLNIGLIYYAFAGYHTILGIFIFLLLVYFFSIWKNLTPKKAFMLGFFVSLVFFSSYHVIILSLASFIFISFKFYQDYRVNQRYGDFFIFYIIGTLSLFIYFSLKDIIVSTPFFDKYKNPDVISFLKQWGGRDIPQVFGSLLREFRHAVSLNLPRGDLSYFYYYLKDFEGIFFLPFLVLGILTPFFFNALSFKKISHLSKDEMGNRKKELFIFLLFNIVVFILTMVLIPLPYVARAYLPVSILVIICGVLGMSMVKKVFVIKFLIPCYLFILILTQLFHYRYFTSSLFKNDGVEGVRIDEIKIEDPRGIIKYLFDLYYFQKVKKIYFVPLVWNMGYSTFKNYSSYKFFMRLMRKGLPVKKIACTDANVKIDYYINENIFYNIIKKRITLDPYYASLNIDIANVFDPHAYHVFDLEETLLYVNKYKDTDLLE